MTSVSGRTERFDKRRVEGRISCVRMWDIVVPFVGIGWDEFGGHRHEDGSAFAYVWMI